jgi:sigma-B regulation protein RsbU (phosphoserine phosphatase)
VVLRPENELVEWMNRNRKVLERVQVEVNPKYASIKDKALEWFAGHSIELLIPVVLEDRVTGLVGIGKKGDLSHYTIMDVELLEKMGRQMGIPIDNALHHQDIIEKERIAEELRLGQKIQTGLLPQAVPDVFRLMVRGFMNPAREIGGDYYDFITLPDKEKFGITIGDVSGKGVAAGLCMAMVKTAIHIFSQKESSPKKILLSTNDILNRHIGGEKFMTLLYLLWNGKESEVTYSSAGHEHILVCRTSQDKVEAIQSGGIILGVKQDIESILEEKRIPLSVGDKILLYTDGVTEALNGNRERFGLERLKEVFGKNSGKSVPDLIESVKKEVYGFIGACPQYDDITLVALEAG